jgi:hypothetical protein
LQRPLPSSLGYIVFSASALFGARHMPGCLESEHFDIQRGWQ